jgi:predicted transcriptional regulator
MPTTQESLTVYLSPEVKAKLAEWAKQDQRSMSFLAAKLITEAVEMWEKNPAKR